MKRKPLDGKKFTRLLVLRDIGARNGVYYSLCQCDCGNIVEIRKGSLSVNGTKSCGCLAREKLIERNKTQKRIIHGMANTSAYHAWEAMIQRCTNDNHPSWKDYGGRGITLCDEWFYFINFHRDMGDPPEGLTLDRIDVNGSYEKSNCRWASYATQNRNMRRNIRLTFHGETKTMKEWSEIIGVSYDLLRGRKRRGWNDEEILNSLPVKPGDYLHGRNRWAHKYNACIECGTTEKRHQGNGRCTPCYFREYFKTRKNGTPLAKEAQ